MAKRRSSGDAGLGMIMLFIFITLILVSIIAFIAQLFIPSCIILGLYLIYYFYNRIYAQSNTMLIILCVAVAISGGCRYIWRNYLYTPEVASVAPTIEITVKNYGFYEDASSSSFRRDGDSYYVKMSDNRYYNQYISSQPKEEGDDRVSIKVFEDVERPSSEEIRVEITPSVKDISNSNKSFSLDNRDFSLGETTLIVAASNSAGTTTATIIIEKVEATATCNNYIAADASLVNLSGSLRKYCSAWQDYLRYQNELKNKPSSSSSGSSVSKPNSSSSSTCYHYEAGRCWDDIENEAYASGQWDGYYGYHGGSYNPPADCTGICEDIYEDAYYEGYDEY